MKVRCIIQFIILVSLVLITSALFPKELEKYITVKKGDTIYLIAKEYGMYDAKYTKFRDKCDLTSLKSIDKIFPGDIIDCSKSFKSIKQEPQMIIQQQKPNDLDLKKNISSLMSNSKNTLEKVENGFTNVESNIKNNFSDANKKIIEQFIGANEKTKSQFNTVNQKIDELPNEMSSFNAIQFAYAVVASIVATVLIALIAEYYIFRRLKEMYLATKEYKYTILIDKIINYMNKIRRKFLEAIKSILRSKK